jgi:N-acetyl-anhydromuramyl-L-alanine amidase AmpD
MKIIEKHGLLHYSSRFRNPKRIILHHTAGGSLSGAEVTLRGRKLAYHYMIDKDGVIYEYVTPNNHASHAYRNNSGTVGVAFVGGGKFGPCNPLQLQAIIDICNHIQAEYPSIKEITGHKHVDPRGWKIDPRWPGEPELGIDWDIDAQYMKQIADATGLKFIKKGYEKGKY